MKLPTRIAIVAILVRATIGLVLVGAAALVPAACSPPPVSGIVVGKEFGSGVCGKRGSCFDYDVTVQTPEGSLVERDVSSGTYGRLEVGQRVDGLVR